MRTESDKNSLFFGLIFLLLSGIVCSGGILWKNFVEFTSSASGLNGVFAGVSDQPAFTISTTERSSDEIVFSFSVPRGELVRFLDIVKPKLDQIVERTGKTAVIDISQNEMEVISKIERKAVDFGSISALNFAEAKDRKHVKAVLERYSIPPKCALFIVKDEDPAKSILDLKGYRIAYKNDSSLPGYLFPVYELKKAGINPTNFFDQESFTDNYSNSILGLKNNEFDCIVVSSNFYVEQPDSAKKGLKTIYESKPLPGGVYITNSDREISYETMIVEGFKKVSETIDISEMFSGMFKVKEPDLEAYEAIAQEFGNGSK